MNKKNIKILCDTMSDLPQGVKEAYDIEFIPTTIIFNNHEYKAGVDITSTDFCELLRNTDTMPTTSQVAYLDYKEVFERNLEEYNSIIYFAGSSAASGTSQVAKLVASEIDGDIHIIDTMNLSIGGGLLVLEALNMVKDGHNLQDILTRIEELKPKVHVFFSVSDLKYLQKGGRISNTKATLGTILNINPILNIDDGIVKPKTQVRGSSKVIPALIECVKETYPNGFANKDVYVGCGDEIEKREKLKARVEKELKPRSVHLFDIGPCIVSHSGPNVIGISCISD